MRRNRPLGDRARRVFLAALGLLCVTLAGLGVIVPGLPTTVFLIAASFLFTRSSPLLERALRRNRWFGPYLRRLREDRGMPRRAKAAAIAMMWSAIGLSCVATGAAALQAATVLLGCLGTATILFYVRTSPSVAFAAARPSSGLPGAEP